MNNLRLILIGIGISIIVGIYLWGVLKSRRQTRDRAKNSYHEEQADIAGIRINPRDDFDDGFSVAVAELGNLSQEPVSADIETDILPPFEKTSEKQDVSDAEVSRKQITGDQLLALYIVASKNRIFTGPEILKAIDSVDMKYGPMKVFHHYDDVDRPSRKTLFSLLNSSEPGYFDINQIEKFKTRGLVLFMQLPALNGGEIVFDKMLDTAWTLAEILGGELHDANHNYLEPAVVNSMREKASLL